jgi:hypothetical protein
MKDTGTTLDRVTSKERWQHATSRYLRKATKVAFRSGRVRFPARRPVKLRFRPPRGEVLRFRAPRPNRQRLPALHETYPDAVAGSRVELGLRTVPVDAIRGTASMGRSTRRRDFLPFPAARGRDWEWRWQRLQLARQTLAVLPPIELLQVGDDYWVVDGHNRVALARSMGQLDIDAVVAAVQWPGGPSTPHVHGLLAPVTEAGAAVRAAAESNAPEF